MLKEQLVKLSKYNVWANDIIANYILTAGEERADLIQVSSFPTIRKTMYHIWDAEVVWLKRLNNEILESWPPSAQFKGNLEEALIEMLLNSKKMEAFIRNLSESNLMDDVVYTSTINKPFKTRVCDVLDAREAFLARENENFFQGQFR